MSRFFVLVCCCAVACCCGATYDQALSSALRSLGEPIGRCPKLNADAIAKESLPSQVAVHKVVPRQFPEELINEVLEQAGLDRAQTFDGADRGVFGTPGVRYYGSQEDNHTLVIIPAQGWMNYMCLEAIDDKGNKTLTGPSEEETLKRGLEFARVLGLRESDLARHPLTNRLDYLFTKIEGGPVRLEPRVKMRGVMFRRAIDGCPVTTGRLFGGYRVEYGYHGMIYQFELVARATEPLSVIKVAPLAEQIEVVRAGKRVYGVRWPAGVRGDSDAALELTLVELVYFEDAPDKFQTIIPPLLRWEGQLRTKGQAQTVILFTPIREMKDE